VTLLSPTQRLLRTRPGVFSPSIIRGITDPDGGLSTFSHEDGQFATTTAVGATSSFRYDPIGSGIKSTQQLNVDWSAFENHVFFNSAEVKVNAAFEKLVNSFPFDGSRFESELFYDKLTGFENYVYQRFPKNKGYLFFSGSNTGDTTAKGTYITVRDIAGSSYGFLTKNPDGASRLDPTSSSISFQFQIYAPSLANSNQMVLQKFNESNGHGFGCYLSQSVSTSNAELTFFVASGSTNTMSASIALEKGTWNPVTFIWDRTSGVNQIRGYVGGTLSSTSSQVTIRNLSFQTSSLFIGTGSNISAPLFHPETTFSGGLDELRYYKRILSTGEMVQYQSQSVYPEGDMALYYKFNEPSGSNTQLVLDCSGQGMHGQLNAYSQAILQVRNFATGSLFGESPMVNEDLRKCPILFPDHPDVISLKTTLMTDAQTYDSYNPNIITKLVPRQYFFYGQIQNAFDTEEGNLNDIQYGSEPNTVAFGSTQTILSLLYMWAGFFDEMKIFLDAFSTLRHVDYDQIDTVPDAFLKQLGDFYGLELPPMFIGSQIDQFVNGENVVANSVNSEYTLQYLQNQIWRRILINAGDILKSKGTLHSIKALLRAVGIEGDNIFRFKEYGGPTQRTLTSLRESRNEVGAVLNFRGGGYMKTPPLSGSRVEPGYPLPVGTFIIDGTTGHNSDTTNENDGLFTSGSWTYEGIYTYAGIPSTSSIQSLARLMNNGPGATDNVLANLYATSGSGATLYIQPNYGTGMSALTMSITAPDILDGQTWNISFGRSRYDEINQTVSSSYFLRIGRNNLGEIVEEYSTASLYNDNGPDANKNLFQKITLTPGLYSPCFLAIGSGSTSINSSVLLNDRPLQTFDGQVGQVRWWTKALTLSEWREHVRDYKSLGVYDPRVNFNFEQFRSGSFQKLRGDWSTDQQTLLSDNLGDIQIFDFSQHNLHATGSGFLVTASVITPHRFYYSFLSPNFDEAATNQKVRVRSYQNLENVLSDDAMYSSPAPVYELIQEQIPEDNGKFSIDFSIVDSLNQDMIGMFSTLDIFNTILGAPNMMFSGDYPDLEILQNIYFNRLSTKLNVRGFFDFYKWFNTNIGKFIEQLIPRKTRYNGINYVITSHLLERSKVEYHFEDQWIGANNRSQQKEVLLLQLFTGLLKKY